MQAEAGQGRVAGGSWQLVQVAARGRPYRNPSCCVAQQVCQRAKQVQHACWANPKLHLQVGVLLHRAPAPHKGTIPLDISSSQRGQRLQRQAAGRRGYDTSSGTGSPRAAQFELMHRARAGSFNMPTQP